MLVQDPSQPPVLFLAFLSVPFLSPRTGYFSKIHQIFFMPCSLITRLGMSPDPIFPLNLPQPQALPLPINPFRPSPLYTLLCDRSFGAGF